MIRYLHLIIFFLLFLDSGFSKDNWKILKKRSSNNKQPLLHIQNISTNEERVTSERRRGKLNIIIKQDKITLSVDWGEFANLEIGNVYYYIKTYGMWEDNWKMSKNSQISYSPDPILLLTQLINSKEIAVGIRPKYNNEIRYYFSLDGLLKIIQNNMVSFEANPKLLAFSQILKNIDSYDTSRVNSALSNFIVKETQLRAFEHDLRSNSRFSFRPIWYESELVSSHKADNSTEKIAYYNHWLKKKGTLFTEKDIRITKLFSKKVNIIQYSDINNATIRGNNIIGYSLYINNKYISRLRNTRGRQLESVKDFIMNKSISFRRS